MDNYRAGGHGQNGGPALSRGVPRFSSPLEDRMRRKLKFFFMNPWQKWKAKKKFPFKMILQVIKVVLVTIQVIFLYKIYLWQALCMNSSQKVISSHVFPCYISCFGLSSTFFLAFYSLFCIFINVHVKTF